MPDEPDIVPPSVPLSTVEPGGRVDRRLLELLVCPVTKSRLDYHEARQELISRAAQLAFPIRNGVPLLVVEAARRLTDDDLPPAGD